ncbi:hypothetical protein ATG66_0592 [Vibrio sp. ES.051]|uniref:hypothetical protein n=1 Tax=Vibrio sp. ES.051 TaxID=1761909 RepID=UPI000BF29D8F|nr:hypothetical protein [Vibrio sp. ES.051]PFG58062.1 hypothetical protein ATG66_0592 [Vibrio sp. ES.051]
MTRFAKTAFLTVVVATFSTVVHAEKKPEQMSNETLLECVNVSNARNAVPEHRAIFKHYLMSEREYSFNQLSSAELEFKATDHDESEVEQTYKKQCQAVGEYLYRIGY